MPHVVWAIALFSSDQWTLSLFGLSAFGFGLFLGRIVFSPSAAPGNPAPGTGLHPPRSRSVSVLDLRSSPRMQVAQTKILVSHTSSTAEPFEGWVTDRSLGGLGLSVAQPVELGTVLQLLPEELPDWVPCLSLEVKYCRLQRGRWQLGCQYVSD